ncbi:late embryogenesis abundant protein 3-like [Durio zibethinus]|uniref:Late embryogenesis abundant protein 3-like n=1 Tax=Durio zibethinus TaxID=66656 RepID=A0A6P6AX84_DURZI|nr:late embryogenesis abundant protein 3-like [Durio zibethinus]
MSLEQIRKPEVDEYSYQEPITVGEALEATTLSIADKPIDPSDAAAIQTAETRATVRCDRQLGGLSATAQSAATFNARAARDEDKITISDVLPDASVRLHHDKAATDEDAEEVIRAERTVKPAESTTPGGVAATMASAARAVISEALGFKITDNGQSNFVVNSI